MTRPKQRPALTLVVDLILPTAAYYVARSAGLSIYLALISSAAIPVAVLLVRLLRERHLDGLAAYVLATVLLGLAVSFIGGSPRFLLAKDGWLTGVAGLAFLASIRVGRPLAYLFSRPLLEGRGRLLPRLPDASWETLWTQTPGFRRAWRVSSAIWGVGLLADAVARVVMAYTLPPDSVPALGGLLYGGTTALILLVTNVYYARIGLFDGRSRLYARTVTCDTSTPRAPAAARSAPAGLLRR
jgi:hypothetical protein